MSKKSLSEKLQAYAKAYKKPPYGREVDGTVELLEETAKKLAEYENLEEQGLLLRLPCKVGDKAWYVHKGGIDEVEVDSFMLNINLFANASFYIAGERFGKTLTPYKTLFFTKAEAEEKLRELERKYNGKGQNV